MGELHRALAIGDDSLSFILHDIIRIPDHSLETAIQIFSSL